MRIEIFSLGIYLTSVMAMTSMSVILAVIVSNISYTGRKDTEMPPFFKSVVLGLARVVCFKLHYVRASVTSGRTSQQCAHSRSNVLYKGVPNHVSNDSGCGLVDLNTNFEFGRTCNTAETPTTGAAALRAEFGRSRQLHQVGHDQYGELDNILQRLHCVLLREDEKDKGENLCREWQEAAEVIDRFLFWIFVVGTVTTTITSLVIMPLLKDNIAS